MGQQEARKWGKTCKVSRFAPVDYTLGMKIEIKMLTVFFLAVLVSTDSTHEYSVQGQNETLCWFSPIFLLPVG